ncbi:MAG: O-antigen ligase family protein [Candidatus Omnitrophota bacterium]
MVNIRRLDLRACAVVSLLVLWTSLTFSIALTEISFVCALVFWIVWHIQLKGTGTFFEKKQGSCACETGWVFWAPLAIFFLFVVASYFASEYPKQSLRGLFKIAKPLLAFWMAASLFREPRSREKFDLVFLATFLLVIVDCSIQYAFGKDLLRGFAAEHASSGIRLIGSFGNFAKMATYLVLVIPVFILRFWSDFTRTGRRRVSFYSLALALAGLTLLYLTRCRGPVVALVLVLSLAAVYKRWFKTIGIVLLIGLALLAVAPRNILIHENAQGKDQSAGERQVLWRRALDVIVAKPLLGTGINTYDKAHAKYDTLRQRKYIAISDGDNQIRQNPDGSVSFVGPRDVWTSDVRQERIRIAGKDYFIHKDSLGKYFIWNDFVAQGYYAHNGYLQLAAEIGLPGIFSLLLFFFIFFRRAYGRLKTVRNSPEEYEQLGIMAGLLTFLLYAAVDNNLQSPPSLMFFWFSAGILMARQNPGSLRDA